jgi:hypothetical protein
MDERTKRIWRGLVNYANTTAIDFTEFRRTVGDCMGWIVATQPIGLLSFTSEESLREQAVKYQQPVRSLLRWLCGDASADDLDLLEYEDDAWEFLDVHTEHIGGVSLKEVNRPQHVSEDLKTLNYTTAEIQHFKDEANRYWEEMERSPLGIWTPTKDYRDLADPICDFLLTEYQKWRNREYARRDKKPAPPVPICACPNCKKLVMPERVGRRKYCSDCSDKARAKSYVEKAPSDENRDYQWLYRLKKTRPELRRARLRQQKVQERLADIKARQQDSHRCKELMRRMGLHVAPTN